jgi:NAD(P)-dependent dehydrogenase (short-subunit alcohol dehydrogenase family)
MNTQEVSIPNRDRGVLITGAARGIGRQTARFGVARITKVLGAFGPESAPAEIVEGIGRIARHNVDR